MFGNGAHAVRYGHRVEVVFRAFEQGGAVGGVEDAIDVLVVPATVLNGNALKACVVSKELLADFAHGGRDGERSNLVAVIECFGGDAGHGVVCAVDGNGRRNYYVAA